MNKQQQYNEYKSWGGTMTIDEWEKDGRYDRSLDTTKRPKYIIRTGEGRLVKYVLNAPFGPDNKRRPVFTEFLEKAMQFDTEDDAHKYTSRILSDRTFFIEPYQTKAYATAG